MKRRTKILILTPNENGKLEFTQEELENLINDAYEEGYECGKADAPAITWPDGVRVPKERHIEKDITWDWRDGPICTGTQPAETAKSISYTGEVPKIQLYGYDPLTENCEKAVSSNRMIYAHVE
jgi:hypothetical protein